MTLAARYAKAWLSLYGDSLIPEDIPKLYALSHVLAYHIDQLTATQIDGTLQEFSDPAPLATMIALLKKDGRLSLTALVLRALADYALRTKNIQYMTFESSHELSKPEREQVAAWAAAETDAQIMYHYTINPHLIVGIALYSNTYAWERSARNALSRYALLIPAGVSYGN